MKTRDIRALQVNELEKRIRDEEENLVHLRFQKATSQLESPIRIRTVRREIARLRTILREKQSAGAAPAAAAQAS